jgi:peptidoglycan/LPS O-acetylase OafA/YrhL
VEREHAAAQPPDGRIMQLDVLRALAILLVLASHAASSRDGGFLQPLDAFLHRIGWSGVDLFFVLSGYLIGGLLFNEIRRHGQLDVRRFLVRRMLRIWPSYYLLLAFLMLRLPWEPGGSLARAWSGMRLAFVHLQNYGWCARDHLWSLAVEEHFYLALPLLLWLLLRQRGRGLAVLPRICLGVSAGCLILRTILHFTTSLDVRMQSYLCMDALFFGVNLAYLRSEQPRIFAWLGRHSNLLLLLACAVYFPCALSLGHVRRTIGYTGVYLAAAALLVAVINARPGQWLWKALHCRLGRWMALMGAHSYSIYLWHRDVSWTAHQIAADAARKLHLPGPLSWLFYTGVAFGASIGVGVLFGKLVEAPAQRLRERFFPPRAVATPAAASIAA